MSDIFNTINHGLVRNYPDATHGPYFHPNFNVDQVRIRQERNCCADTPCGNIVCSACNSSYEGFEFGGLSAYEHLFPNAHYSQVALSMSKHLTASDLTPELFQVKRNQLVDAIRSSRFKNRWWLGRLAIHRVDSSAGDVKEDTFNLEAYVITPHLSNRSMQRLARVCESTFVDDVDLTCFDQHFDSPAFSIGDDWYTCGVNEERSDEEADFEMALLRQLAPIHFRDLFVNVDFPICFLKD